MKNLVCMYYIDIIVIMQLGQIQLSYLSQVPSKYLYVPAFHLICSPVLPAPSAPAMPCARDCYRRTGASFAPSTSFDL